MYVFVCESNTIICRDVMYSKCMVKELQAANAMLVAWAAIKAT